MEKVMTTETFIQKAKEVHGDKYDYSATNFKKKSVPVDIVCLEHGKYSVSPFVHLKGKGCPVCSPYKRVVNHKKTTEDFVREASEVHNNWYTYEEAEYTGAHGKVRINCPLHGVFEQTATSHLAGSGCKHCAQERLWKHRKRNLRPFIERAEEVHGKGVYDYSKCDLKKYKRKDHVEIRCVKHDSWFVQKIHDHLVGNKGCPYCRNNYKPDEKFFEEKARNVHGDKYDYSFVEYKGAHEKVKIRCPIHNHIFEQTPDSHVRGAGCSKCAEERRGWGRSGIYGTYEQSHLYVIEAETPEEAWVKVGLSVQPERRVKEYIGEVGDCQADIKALWGGPAYDLFTLERYTLFRTEVERYQNEDWEWAGRTECFAQGTAESVINAISALIEQYDLNSVERIL